MKSKTLEIDLNTTEELVKEIKSDDKVIVCESGINSHKDVLRFKNKVNGFLIGTSLMKEKHLTKAVKEIIFGNIKVCGITRINDAKIVSEYGATMAGLIFAKESKRYISINKAKEIIENTNNELDWFGVFVNSETKNVVSIAQEIGLKGIQLHGEESFDYIDEVKNLFRGQKCEIWKAYRISDNLPDLSKSNADKILFSSSFTR